MKVLCAGDLHIGRRSSKLPDAHAGPQHSCAAAWDAIVETALVERADVVALSGDLVDQTNRYFEAVGPLERGIRRLSAAGIDTFAVAGNHDYNVLPQLADTLDSEHFHLIGRGGRWERKTVTRDGKPALHVDGWSFPSEAVFESPLAGYDLVHGETPVIGILHADLDQARSRYAPVSLTDLQRYPVALWLLGHIHSASIVERPGVPTVMYPGSPQAMDPGEGGVHGVWMVEVGPGGSITHRQIPISTVRYMSLEVDVDGVESGGEVNERIVGVVRSALTAGENRYDRLQCISCRLTLTGRTPLHRELPSLLQAAEEDLGLTGEDGVEAVIERIYYQTRPAVDLSELAKRNDPPGEVARFIQAVESGSGSTTYRKLIADTVQRLRSVHEANTYAPIATDPEPDESDACRYLLDEAWSLLDTLVAQKEGA